jgi:hypothetical protein
MSQEYGKPPIKAKVFQVKTEEYFGECGVIPAVVYMPHVVNDRIRALINEYPTKEWLAYLRGNGMTIASLLIPKQEVGYAFVDNIEYPKGVTDIIGVVHSHHSFDATHSGTDDKYLVGNHHISIVTGTDGRYEVKVKSKVPCGKVLIRTGEVKLITEDMTEFIEYAKGQIKEITYAPKGLWQAYGGYAGGYDWE